MEEVGMVEPRRLQVERVVRSMEVTDSGRAVISVEAGGTSLELEMSPDQAADLSDGLARSLRMLESRRR